MMVLEDNQNLTNEKLFERFQSPFNLVNHAIVIARNVIKRGEEHSNLANEVIDLIIEGDDRLYQDEEMQ